MSISGSANIDEWQKISENIGLTSENTDQVLTKIKPRPLTLPTMNEDEFEEKNNNVSCVMDKNTHLPLVESSFAVRQRAFDLCRYDGVRINARNAEELVSFPTESFQNLSISQVPSSWSSHMRNSGRIDNHKNGIIEETSSQGSSGAGSSGGSMAYTAVRKSEISASNSEFFGGRALLMAPNGDPSPPTLTPTTLFAQTREEKLLALTNQTGYNIVQRNGQMIYGGPPPNWYGPAPCKGSEIFVGKVPRDIYEDELVPIFERVGMIYELRLMMDFSGSNRGYFFVRYTCKEDAKRAVRELNNYEIRPGKPLGVIHSVDNRKLWISGIPQNRSPSEIQAEMEKLTDGVRGVILYASQQDKSKSRGYAFVEYESHRAAALARRKLVPGRIFLCGQEIEKVDWAEPENEVDEETMSKVRVLFLRNLMATTTEHQIRHIFNYLSGGQVERVKKAKDFAFVHFATREAAEKAKEQSNDLRLDGTSVEVTWSKPVNKALHNQRKQYIPHGFSGSMSHFYHDDHVVRSNNSSEPEISFNHDFTEPPPILNRRNNDIMKQTGSLYAPSMTRKLVGANGISNGMHADQIHVPTQAMYTDHFLQTLHDLKLLGNIQPSIVPANSSYSIQQQNMINPLAFYGEAIKNQLLNGNVGLQLNQENPYTIPPPNNYMNSGHSMMEPSAEKQCLTNVQSNDYLSMNSNTYSSGIMNNCGQAYASSQSFPLQPTGMAGKVNMEQ